MNFALRLVSRNLFRRFCTTRLCVFASAGTQVPPHFMEVRSSGLGLSRFNRLACLEQGIYPRRNGGCVGDGKPTYAALFLYHQ